MLDVRIPDGVERSNSLPSGHTDVNRRHPGLEEDLLKGVLVTKVPSAFFRRKVIEDETTEDVEQLSKVGEAVDVVREEPKRVILVLHGSFSEEHKRLGGSETPRPFPFVLDSLIGVPRALGHGAFQQAVLGRFLGTRITNFALGWYPHELEPSANREALVESKLDECAHLPWADVVQDSSNHLKGCGILQVEALYENEHVRSVRCFLGVVVALFWRCNQRKGHPQESERFASATPMGPMGGLG
ncbi:unnamed protein product [Sphagnum tenellum]